MQSKQLSTQKFVRRAEEIHGTRYSYKNLTYKNMNTEVCITCTIHGEFSQLPYVHLRGSGCQKCAFAKSPEHRAKIGKRSRERRHTIMSRARMSIAHERPWTEKRRRAYEKTHQTFDEWLQLAKEQHGDKYIYDKTLTNFTGKKTERLTITCPIHGDFTCVSFKHLIGGTSYGRLPSGISRQTIFRKQGGGCPKCFRAIFIAPSISNKAKFISSAELLHGDGTFNYTDSVYKGSRQPIKIYCLRHGLFITTPQYHLNNMSGGCTACADERRRRGRLPVTGVHVRKPIAMRLGIMKHITPATAETSTGRHPVWFAWKLYNEDPDLTLYDLAARFGTSVRTIRNWFRRILPPGHTISQCRQAKVFDEQMGMAMLRAGSSLSQIGGKFNVSPQTVSRRLSKYSDYKQYANANANNRTGKN